MKDFASEIEACRKQVYSLMRRCQLGHEDAQDVTQQAMIRAWQSRDGYTGPKLTPWVCRIAVRLLLDLKRYEKSRVSTVSYHVPNPRLVGEDVPYCDSFADPVNSFADVELRDCLAQVFNEFGASDSMKAVWLHDVEGHDEPDIAVMFGAQLGTTHSRIHRGRVRLRPILREQLAVA